MSKIEHTVETTTIDTTIESSELTAVVGGDNQPAGYNGEDVKNAIKGGVSGARLGPVGVAVGAGAGFMSRNVGNLFDATRDYFRESQRSNQLDQQRQQLQQRRGGN